MLKHLKPVRPPPLSMDMYVGREASSLELQFVFKFVPGLSFYRALSSLLGACTQLQGRAKLHKYLGLSQVIPILTWNVIQECVCPKLYCNPKLLELSYRPSLAPVKICIHRQCHWASPPKELS